MEILKGTIIGDGSNTNMEILKGTIIGDGSNTNTVPPVNPVQNTDANKSEQSEHGSEHGHGENEDFAKIFNETLNKFSEENPNDSEEVKKSKGFKNPL